MPAPTINYCGADAASGLAGKAGTSRWCLQFKDVRIRIESIWKWITFPIPFRFPCLNATRIRLAFE